VAEPVQTPPSGPPPRAGGLNPPAVRTETIDLAVDDGTSMRAHVARPDDAGRRPGLLLCQEAYGVNAHIRDVAGRFARVGYVVIAAELYHRTAAGKQYVNVEISDADHAFFCDARQSFHPAAAREAWALTLAFLEDALRD